MSVFFEKDKFCGLILSEDLLGAIAYLDSLEDKSMYTDQINLFKYKKFRRIFDDSYLDELYQIYQLYFIELLYDKLSPNVAENNMKNRFVQFFNIQRPIEKFYKIEENNISDAFTNKGYYFLRVYTGGYFGPYIWKSSQLKEYSIELPQGSTKYKVRLNSGFKSNSWLHFLSSGLIGTAGWADKDGVIACVEDKQDLNIEKFKVSLLKHEAQHQADYLRYGQDKVTSFELEYRAKLIELIYSYNNEKLISIINERDNSREDNFHSLAAYKILENMKKITGENLSLINRKEINKLALKLFNQNTLELDEKYNVI